MKTNPESSAWNPESTAWSPESKTGLDNDYTMGDAMLFLVSPVTEGSSSPVATLATTPPKPECFHQSLTLPISQELFMDKKLQGHVIWQQSVFSELQCEDLCIRVPGCLAYNYHYSGEMAQKACELMNEVRVVNNTLGYSFRLFERERVLKVSKRLLH